MRRKSNIKRIIGNFATYVILIIASIVALFPLYWIVMTAFKLPAESHSIPPKWLFIPTLRNFTIVLFEDPFPKFLLNSLIIVSLSVLIVIVLGSFAGYAFARFKLKHRESFFFFILTTRMGPPIAFAVPFYMIMNGLGLLDSYPAMILIYTLFNLAFCIWMTQGFFQEVPLESEEAAMLDGCSRIQTFFKIAFPLALPGIVATAIFCFIITWNEFFYSMILTNYYAKTFTVHMPSFVGAPRIRWSEMSAASTLAMIPVIAFAISVRRYLVRGLTMGAIKG